MKKIKNLIIKYKELLLYLIFGVLTTVVSIVSFWLFGLFIPDKLYLITNVISWIISVTFAFITNKLFVFESKKWGKAELSSEIPKFLGARVFSLVIEELGLILFIDLLNFNEFSKVIFGFNITGELIAKTIMSVIVIILNYFFSKFLIFTKNKKNQ
ncbi:MAG: GtrA family protein [Clostridia bacterium]|nr:GtrA family protein [Clostridia bacterium]